MYAFLLPVNQKSLFIVFLIVFGLLQEKFYFSLQFIPTYITPVNDLKYNLFLFL